MFAAFGVLIVVGLAVTAVLIVDYQSEDPKVKKPKAASQHRHQSRLRRPSTR